MDVLTRECALRRADDDAVDWRDTGLDVMICQSHGVSGT